MQVIRSYLLAIFLGLTGCATTYETYDYPEQKIYRIITPGTPQNDNSIIFGTYRWTYAMYGDYSYVNIIAVDETKVGEYKGILPQPPKNQLTFPSTKFAQFILSYRVELTPGKHSLLALEYLGSGVCRFLELEYYIEPNKVYTVRDSLWHDVSIIDTQSDEATRFSDSIETTTMSWYDSTCYLIESIRNNFIDKNKKENR
jgi:hypothetical protein